MIGHISEQNNDLGEVLRAFDGPAMSLPALNR